MRTEGFAFVNFAPLLLENAPVVGRLILPNVGRGFLTKVAPAALLQKLFPKKKTRTRLQERFDATHVIKIEEAYLIVEKHLSEFGGVTELGDAMNKLMPLRPPPIHGDALSIGLAERIGIEMREKALTQKNKSHVERRIMRARKKNTERELLLGIGLPYVANYGEIPFRSAPARLVSHFDNHQTDERIKHGALARYSYPTGYHQRHKYEIDLKKDKSES